ncbi:hypothetical protein C6381_17555 [Pseudomonas syringae pv. actinidiae]|nr:hypothetical protein C6381_17555 [Pseudomonas syringae pv. actinidiae]
MSKVRTLPAISKWFRFSVIVGGNDSHWTSRKIPSASKAPINRVNNTPPQTSAFMQDNITGDGVGTRAQFTQQPKRTTGQSGGDIASR